MTVNYNQTTINGRLNVVVTNIDAGPSFGVMSILGGPNLPLQTVGLINLKKPSGTVEWWRPDIFWSTFGRAADTYRHKHYGG